MTKFLLVLLHQYIPPPPALVLYYNHVNSYRVREMFYIETDYAYQPSLQGI